MLHILHMLADSLMDDERIINSDVMYDLIRIEISSYQYMKLYQAPLLHRMVVLFSWVLVISLLMTDICRHITISSVRLHSLKVLQRTECWHIISPVHVGQYRFDFNPSSSIWAMSVDMFIEHDAPFARWQITPHIGRWWSLSRHDDTSRGVMASPACWGAVAAALWTAISGSTIETLSESMGT